MNDRAAAARDAAWRTAAAVGVGGLALFVPAAVIAGNGRVGAAEEELFRAVNGLPGWLEAPLWVFQQLGNVVVALVVLLLLAGLRRDRWLAAAAGVAVVAKLALERAVKSVVERARPGATVGDVRYRGDVPEFGLSFVSGHAVITAAGATLLMAVLPSRWKWVPWAVVVLNGFGRVYVGAHNPLDIVGGVGVGLVIGAPLYAVLLTRGQRRARPPG